MNQTQQAPEQSSVLQKSKGGASGGGILLAFAPFLAFAIANQLVGTFPALLIGAGTSLALILRSVLVEKQGVRILEAGTFVLMLGLAVVSKLQAAPWPTLMVRLWVDAGLLTIVLLSLAIRQPFTLQYARAQVTPEIAASPEFLRVNDVITGAWAAAFLVIVAADALMLFVPSVPKFVGIGLTVAALYSAYHFTASYSGRKP